MKLRELFLPPMFSFRFGIIWWRNFLVFKESYLQFLFWGIFEPLIYLGTIGLGVGALINHVNGQSYFQFFYPGFLANTAITLAFLEASISGHERLTSKIYEPALRGSVSPDDVIWGELFWAVSKSLVAVIFFVGVGFGIGHFEYQNLLKVGLFLVFGATTGAALGLLLGVLISQQRQFTFFVSGVMIPASLVSGAFFPITFYPQWLQNALLVIPHTHLIKASQMLANGRFDPDIFLSLAILFLMTFILLNAAVAAYKRRLVY